MAQGWNGGGAAAKHLVMGTNHFIRRENTMNFVIPGLTRNPVQPNSKWRALPITCHHLDTGFRRYDVSTICVPGQMMIANFSASCSVKRGGQLAAPMILAALMAIVLPGLS